MARWTIAAGPRVYTPTASDCPVGWAWDLEAGRNTRTVNIEISLAAYTTAANREPLPSKEAEEARRSRGRSAVSAHLDDEDPPMRLVISADGVRSDTV